MILVDTNVWREASHPQGNARVRQWLGEQQDELLLSAIVLSEIAFGVAKMPEGKRQLAQIGWTGELEREMAGRLLPFDAASARCFGQLAWASKQRGENVGVIDLQIAAQAVAHALTIATRNTKDFAHTGLEVIDPWTA